jgi:hypothetical protein
MVGLLKALVYGAGGMAVVGLAALVALQERLVYVPVLPGLARAYSITPSRLRLVYEDVWLRAADGVRLHSWFIRHSPTCRGKHPAPSPILPSLSRFGLLVLPRVQCVDRYRWCSVSCGTSASGSSRGWIGGLCFDPNCVGR